MPFSTCTVDNLNLLGTLDVNMPLSGDNCTLFNELFMVLYFICIRLIPYTQITRSLDVCFVSFCSFYFGHFITCL